MHSDPFKEFSALERELQKENQRPSVWAAVLRGEMSPEQAVQILRRDGLTDAELIARDQALFSPIDPARRDELLLQILSVTGSAQQRRLARRRSLIAATVGLAATLGLLLLVFVREPRLPVPEQISELPRDIPCSVEIIGGAASVRSNPKTYSVEPDTARLPAGRPFRVVVRIQERSFDLHRVIARCGALERQLPFTVLAARPGLLEAEIRAELEAGQRCELELQIGEGGRVVRLPNTSDQIMEVVPP